MPAPEKPAQELLGYPNIEKLLDTEDFAAVNKNFADAYEKLEKIAKEGGLKSRQGARDAMKAYELTADLVKELLQLKYEMAKAGDKTK